MGQDVKKQDVKRGWEARGPFAFEVNTTVSRHKILLQRRIKTVLQFCFSSVTLASLDMIHILNILGTSPVVQWLRICLPVEGSQV